MYENLKAEMARKNVTSSDVANALKVSRKTLNNKMNGSTKFSLDEGFTIIETFFPDCDFDFYYLFGRKTIPKKTG